MNLTKLFILFCTGMLISPLIYGSWHDWDETNLSKIQTTACTHSFDTNIYFQGPSSIKVDYSNSASITFPYRYADEDLYYKCYFFMSVYNPSSSHKNDTLQVEFIDNTAVIATAKVVTKRKGWNRFEIIQEARYDKYSLLVGIESIDNYIPRKPDEIRIRFPKDKEGTMHIGKLYLAKAMNKEGEDIEFENLAGLVNQDDIQKPALPATVSKDDLADMASVENRLKELFGVASYTQTTNIATDVMDDIRTKYQAYNIHRNGDVVLGNNHMLHTGAADYISNERSLSDLLFLIAKSINTISDATQIQELTNIFYDLFDFATFIGGMPDDWAGGRNFIPAIYLMQDQLKSTGRLTNDLLREYQIRIGYDRAFLDYSYAMSTGRKYIEGDNGENVDYLRITSKRLAFLALLNNSVEERYRDLKEVSRYFSDIAFQHSPGVSDGFKPDGTAYHHWGWIDQYGAEATFTGAEVAYVFANTQFKLTEQAMLNIKNQLLMEDMRSLYNIIPKHTSGKGGHPYSYGGNSMLSAKRYAYQALAGSPDGSSVIDTDMASIFLRNIANKAVATGANETVSPFEEKINTKLMAEGFTANEHPSGHHTYGYGAMFVHRRDNWLLTMKGHSKFQYVRESGDPFITYLGYGMLHVVQDVWNRYGSTKLSTDFGKDGYDWRKLPGTTTVHFQQFENMVNKEYKRYYAKQTFVGGLTQDGNGIFTMPIIGSEKNGLGSFRAKKSWFCFDDYVVAVGSGITNALSSETTATTLYQDAVSSSSKTYFNSTSGTTSNSSEAQEVTTTSKWLVDSENLGYWVPKSTDLVVYRGSQSAPDWGNSKNTSGTYATVWINHGKAPLNKTYWYIQRMNTTPQAMDQFNQQMGKDTAPFKLLKNTEEVHAVESTNNNTYGVVAFNESNDVGVKDIKSVSSSCVLMVKFDDNENMVLSASYPDLDFINHTTETKNDNWGYSTPHTVEIEIAGDWSVHQSISENVTVTPNTAEQTTKISFLVKDGATSTIVLSGERIVTSTELEEKLSSFIVWPNPFKNHLSITLEGITNAKNIKIIGSSGNVIYSENLNGETLIDHAIHLDEKQIPSGYYVIVITTETDQIFKEKIIKL
ncbi:T9SS type A sorting domain-containing protein [Puteibacter caeruleilacunae]|nr:T9SS type A sorting domain-containing protein [Puteibacter caeruleilacunae]